MNFKIRDAQECDLASIHHIFNEVLINSTATFEEVPYSIQTWSEIFSHKKTGGFPVIVVEVNNLVIGYGTFGPFRKASGYKITVEHSLHVDKKFRGKGIGKEILKELIMRARAFGAENMVGAIDESNSLSIQLHEKFGFKITGRMENIARKFSRDLNLVLMQLRL